jgi:hypothetical protein
LHSFWQGVVDIAFSSSGFSLAIASADGTVSLWALLSPSPASDDSISSSSSSSLHARCMHTFSSSSSSGARQIFFGAGSDSIVIVIDAKRTHISMFIRPLGLLSQFKALSLSQHPSSDVLIAWPSLSSSSSTSSIDNSSSSTYEVSSTELNHEDSPVLIGFLEFSASECPISIQHITQDPSGCFLAIPFSPAPLSPGNDIHTGVALLHLQQPVANWANQTTQPLLASLQFTPSASASSSSTSSSSFESWSSLNKLCSLVSYGLLAAPRFDYVSALNMTSPCLSVALYSPHAHSGMLTFLDLSLIQCLVSILVVV